METQKRIVMAIALLLICAGVHAQKLKIWDERKGCVRAQGNLAGGYLFKQRQTAAYLTGDIDLFVDSRVSVNGQIWGSFVTARRNQPGIRANHSVLWGINYHPVVKGRFDPYIGLTPGVGLVRSAFSNGEVLQKSNFSVVPLVSAQVGMNYYVGWIFHFFAKVQGVSGIFFGNAPAPQRLEELKFTAGLGWNLRLWKPRQKNTTQMPVLMGG